MTQENEEGTYTGGEAVESQELIDKVRRLSLEAQSVLYAMFLEEGEEAPAAREGFTINEVHEACAACSLDDAATPEGLIEAGVAELEKRGFIKAREGRLWLLTRVEHMRTFEKAVESSRYVVRR